jgi:hypothetical protein
MAIAPIPPVTVDKAKVEVYQEKKVVELKKAAEQARKKVASIKKKTDETRKAITDWTKWYTDIDRQLMLGFNWDANNDDVNESYAGFPNPYEITVSIGLTTEEFEAWAARGRAKVASLKKVLKNLETSSTAATKTFINALQKYEAAAKKAGQKINVNTNTLEGIESASGIDYDNNGTIGSVTNGGGGGGGGGNAGGNGSDDDTKTVLKNKDAKRVKIQFNIPMVKSAYFPNRGIQDDVISEKVSSWTTKDNGRKMWLGDAGGKGVIQPNLAVAATQLSKTYKNSKAIVKDLNNKLFGFRFLYNPSSISMGWGIAQEVDPNTIGLGLDKGIPLTGNLSPSSISFELILNRVEDMNHLDSEGWKRALTNPGFFDEVTRTGVYPTYSNENPWPTAASPVTFIEDLQEIYERGTMYDIDYLFASLMPGAPKYRSNLNGILADRGYMSGYTCELHLGPRMRYNVQIASLNVEHIMFNERMVPTLSKVSITATRLPDVRQGIVKGYGINTKDYAAEKDPNKVALGSKG